MKIAIISDIHSNKEALQLALEMAGQRNVDEIVCLGDIVGYGPDPAFCVDAIRQNCKRVVLGNHDLAVAREIGLEYLPGYGKQAAIHNRKALSSEQLEYLASLPLIEKNDTATFVHATPQTPELWLRLDSFLIAQKQFEHFDTEICFIGHTHYPGLMCSKLGIHTVRKGNRYIVNVGSVGQPRDGNPRLSFGIFDDETFEFELLRGAYNIEATVTRVREEGLPNWLGSRLKKGE